MTLVCKVHAPRDAELLSEVYVTGACVPLGYGYNNGGGVIINNNNSESPPYCLLFASLSACAHAGIASEQKCNSLYASTAKIKAGSPDTML